jgi:hypothetical protein
MWQVLTGKGFGPFTGRVDVQLKLREMTFSEGHLRPGPWDKRRVNAEGRPGRYPVVKSFLKTVRGRWPIYAELQVAHVRIDLHALQASFQHGVSARNIGGWHQRSRDY